MLGTKKGLLCSALGQLCKLALIPQIHRASMQAVCEQLQVQSQNDTAKLAEAKQLVYLKVWEWGQCREDTHFPLLTVVPGVGVFATGLGRPARHPC